jgi:hypothetical protein
VELQLADLSTTAPFICQDEKYELIYVILIYIHRSERRSDNLTAICEPIVWRKWQPQRLTTPWASTACYRDTL